MEKKVAKSGSITISLLNNRIILSELSGFIDESSSINSMKETRLLADNLRAEGRPVLLLIDGSKVTGQTSGARSSTKALAGMGINRLAVCGESITTSLVSQYLLRVNKAAKAAKSFRTRGKAERWLLHPKDKTDSATKSSIVACLLLILMAWAAYLIWSTRSAVVAELVPRITIINPSVALTFGLLAVSVITLHLSKNPRYNTIGRWFAGAIIVWVMVFSASIWIRTIFGFDMHLDKLISPDRITAEATAAPRTALNLWAAGIALLTILTGQRKRWEQLVFHTTISIIALNVFAIVLGYSFGYTFTQTTGYVPMPLTTALCFLILVYALMPFGKPLAPYKQIVSYFDRHLLPIGIFVITITFTGFVWQQSKINLQQNINSKVAEEFKKQQTAIAERISSYESLLYAFRSLFEASTSVSADEFTTFFSSSEIGERYPGLNGIAYVGAVSATDRLIYQSQTRQQASVLNPQLGDFAAHPASTQPVSYILTYIEPDKNNVKDALGFDLSTSKERYTILNEARDTGKAKSTTTININMAVLDKAPYKPGALITVPIYRDKLTLGEPKTVEERRVRLNGFINASFVYNELFADVLGEEKASDFKLVIREADNGNNIYTYNASAKDVKPDLSYESNIKVGDRDWRLAMYTNSAFGSTRQERLLPASVIMSGAALSVLAMMLAQSLMRKRETAIVLAEAMTEDLNNERNSAIASQKRDEAILSSIADGVFVIDSGGKIILFNPSTEKISGFTADEAVGKHYGKILRFEDAHTGKIKDDFIRQALSGKVTRMHDHLVLIRKGGNRVAVADSAAPLKDYKQKTIGAIVVFRDVTKETELDQAKDEFVSLASHQLRTPLSAINWYSEMLLNGDAGQIHKTQKEYIQEIYDGNQRMISLVNSLLDVSRIDLGKFVNEPVDISIPGLVDSLHKEMLEMIASKDIKIKKVIQDDLPAIYADPKMLRAIIQNLISNAVKYTPAKGTITLKAQVADPKDCTDAKVCLPGKYIAIRVADTGYGIPASQQDRIFEKLFRADNARTLDVEGTGLGLYYIKQIINKLGGNISFKSTESVGTEFTVMLPLKTKKTAIAHDTINNRGKKL